ncbi:37864_t:CDS:2 [Gigaspora margarita]|uniref:37864_t:CDS:1 n=1 Tax=Gigaspora margarita TaxID=4874 RepID=A0ABN7UXQ3_GIGMA|nr:37864_t:CDS:2 [Gigaspora margarita]
MYENRNTNYYKRLKQVEVALENMKNSSASGRSEIVYPLFKNAIFEVKKLFISIVKICIKLGKMLQE